MNYVCLKLNILKKIGIVAFISVTVLTLFPSNGAAITVGPVKLEYTADPGTEITGDIYIKNEEQVEKVFYPSIEGFTEQNGLKVFNEDSLLTEWFTTNKSVTLKPGDSVKVPYTINIPTNAPAGGQFAVIWWGTQDKSAASSSVSQNVSIQTRAGILIYVNVNGDIIESAKVSKLFEDAKSTFYFDQSVLFPYSIKNTGTVYIKPKGSVAVASIFGKEISSIPINSKGYQILPNSYRDFNDTVWKAGKFSIGLYKVHFSLEYGNKGNSIIKDKWIVLLPVKSVSIVLLVLLVIWFFFRSYNKWLVSKYVHEHEDPAQTPKTSI